MLQRVLMVAGTLTVLVVTGILVSGPHERGEHENPWEIVTELGEHSREVRFDTDELLAKGLGRGTKGAPAVTHRAGERQAGRGSDARGTMSSVGQGAYEPSIGVSRSGAVFYNASGGNGSTVVMRTRDEGKTWEPMDISVPGVESDQPTVDPMLYVDPATGWIFNGDLTPPCSLVQHSSDDGDTWSVGTICAHADHQNIFAGPAPAGTPKPTGYANVVYWCALDEGLAHSSVTTACSRSRDGGTTWERTAAPAFEAIPGNEENGHFGVPGGCGGVTGHGRVGPDGTVYIPRGLCHHPYLAFSKDQGDTWERVKVNGDLKMAVGIDDMIVTGGPPHGGVIDHEGRVAIDPAGNVFYMWIAEDHLPYLAVSRDGGKSFGKPSMVGFPGIDEAWGPAIEAGETGRIAISYLGTSNSPGPPYCTTTTADSCLTADGKPPRAPEEYAKTDWSGYIGVSVDALSATPTFTTAAINDPADPIVRGQCKPVQCQAEADFHGMAVGPDGTPWVALVDGCPATGGQPDCAANGIGVAGRLVGAPPLYGTIADQKPVVTAPPAPGCRSTRRFTLKIRKPRRAKIRSVRVTVDGKRVRARRKRGRYSAVIDLRGRPRGRAVVRTTIRTSAGRVFRTTRRYRTC
jgi:hypothetical protein